MTAIAPACPTQPVTVLCHAWRPLYGAESPVGLIWKPTVAALVARLEEISGHQVEVIGRRTVTDRING